MDRQCKEFLRVILSFSLCSFSCRSEALSWLGTAQFKQVAYGSEEHTSEQRFK